MDALNKDSKLFFYQNDKPMNFGNSSQKFQKQDISDMNSAPTLNFEESIININQSNIIQNINQNNDINQQNIPNLIDIQKDKMTQGAQNISNSYMFQNNNNNMQTSIVYRPFNNIQNNNFINQQNNIPNLEDINRNNFTQKGHNPDNSFNIQLNNKINMPMNMPLNNEFQPFQQDVYNMNILIERLQNGDETLYEQYLRDLKDIKHLVKIWRNMENYAKFSSLDKEDEKCLLYYILNKIQDIIIENMINNKFKNNLDLDLFTKEISNILEQLYFLDNKSYGSLNNNNFNNIFNQNQNQGFNNSSENILNLNEIINIKIINIQNNNYNNQIISNHNNIIFYNSKEKTEAYYLYKMCKRHPGNLFTNYENIKNTINNINRNLFDYNNQNSYIKNILENIREINNLIVNMRNEKKLDLPDYSFLLKEKDIIIKSEQENKMENNNNRIMNNNFNNNIININNNMNNNFNIINNNYNNNMININDQTIPNNSRMNNLFDNTNNNIFQEESDPNIKNISNIIKKWNNINNFFIFGPLDRNDEQYLISVILNKLQELIFQNKITNQNKLQFVKNSLQLLWNICNLSYGKLNIKCQLCEKINLQIKIGPRLIKLKYQDEGQDLRVVLDIFQNCQQYIYNKEQQINNNKNYLLNIANGNPLDIKDLKELINIQNNHSICFIIWETKESSNLILEKLNTFFKNSLNNIMNNGKIKN